jgi:hypothetical protein
MRIPIDVFLSWMYVVMWGVELRSMNIRHMIDMDSPFQKRRKLRLLGSTYYVDSRNMLRQSDITGGAYET